MIWLSIAVLIILTLTGYAAYLWSKVYTKNQEELALQKQSEEEKAQAEIKHQNYLQTSLHVIARSVLNGELNISEGCIRVKVLLDNLNEDLKDFNNEMDVIDAVYEQLQQFDTHQARNELNEKDRKKQDRKRHFIEHKNQDALQGAFSILVEKYQIIPE